MAEQQYASFAKKDVKQVSNSNLWDNVDAVITGAKFTKTMPEGYTVTAKPGEVPMGILVDFEIDGQAPVEERRVNQFFSLGGKIGVSWDITADGHKLTPKVDGAEIYTSNGTKFMGSLEENGVPPALLGDLSKIVGLKGHFKRIEDKTRDAVTRTFTKRDGTQGSATEQPKILLCTKVISLPGVGAATTSAPAAAAAPAEDFDLDTAATDALVALLKAKKGKQLQRSQILLGVSQIVGADPNRAVIARRAQEEAFVLSLAELGVIVYDAESKTGKGQPLTLPVAAAA